MCCVTYFIIKMDAITFDMISKQLHYQTVSIREGEGVVMQLYSDGPFVVYSRISADKVLGYVRAYCPKINSLDEMKTIFLLGPTPPFFGSNRATTSWRRSFLEYLTNNKSLNDNFLIVLPEPYSCEWKDVDYKCLTEPMEHIYAQVHWEDYFIDLAVKTGVLVLHAHFRWLGGGNAGPTARFEGGKLLSLLKEDKLTAAVINLPKDSQTIQYITTHLVHALSLYNKGRFLLTECSPLTLNDNNFPIDRDGKIMEAGLYPDGSIIDGNLNPFFNAITNIANKL